MDTNKIYAVLVMAALLAAPVFAAEKGGACKCPPTPPKKAAAPKKQAPAPKKDLSIYDVGGFQ